MPEDEMFTVDVYQKGKLLFTYRTYLVPNRGDLIESVGHGTLLVKRCVGFPLLPDSFDLHVKAAK